MEDGGTGTQTRENAAPRSGSTMQIRSNMRVDCERGIKEGGAFCEGEDGGGGRTEGMERGPLTFWRSPRFHPACAECEIRQKRRRSSNQSALTFNLQTGSITRPVRPIRRFSWGVSTRDTRRRLPRQRRGFCVSYIHSLLRSHHPRAEKSVGGQKDGG